MLKQVRSAKIHDIQGILSVLKQNLLAHKTINNPDILAKTGFLITPITFDDAKSAILDEKNFIFLVATEHQDIIGYALGCDVNTLNKDFQNELASVSQVIRQIIFSEKILYLRHIAKKPHKNRVGSELLCQLMKQASDKGYKYIICIIAEKPIENKASKNFHERNAFICMGYFQDNDRKTGVYLKKI